MESGPVRSSLRISLSKESTKFVLCGREKVVVEILGCQEEMI